MTEDAKRGLLGRWLRIPPGPAEAGTLPEGARVFRAARGFYFLRLLRWLGKQAGALVGIYWGLEFFAHLSRLPFLGFLSILEYLGIAAYLVQVPFSLMLVRLDYRMRWYVVSARSLMIREGILSIRQQTMSFANIQNLAVRQGPLQRLLGIADLEVRTAGGGSGKSEPGGDVSSRSSLHLGYFRGVDNAPAIRDAILERLRRLKDSGLGDPDDRRMRGAATAEPGERGEPAGGSGEVLEAAAELLTAARALRAQAGPAPAAAKPP